MGILTAPLFSNPSKRIAIRWDDHGDVICPGKYVTKFFFDNTVVESVFEWQWRSSPNVEMRFKHDCDILRNFDIKLEDATFED